MPAMQLSAAKTSISIHINLLIRILISKIIETEESLNNLLDQQPEQSNSWLAAAIEWSWAVWEEADLLGPLTLSGEQINSGLHLAQNPVYICGVHHSGTTLVRNILQGQPELVVLPSKSAYCANLESKLRMLPETEQLAFLCTGWLRRLANPGHDQSCWMLGRSAGAISPYVTFARYLMSWWEIAAKMESEQWPNIAVVLAYATITDNLHAKLWVDKTPTNERFLTRIWQEMPNAKIIHVIREPFAVINSVKMMDPSLNMQAALTDLELSFRIAFDLSPLKDPGYLLLRYEDLFDDLPDVAEKLSSFLNVGISEISDHSPLAGQAEILSLAEHQLVASYVGTLAGKFNYPVKQVGFLRKLCLRLKYNFLQSA